MACGPRAVGQASARTNAGRRPQEILLGCGKQSQPSQWGGVSCWRHESGVWACAGFVVSFRGTREGADEGARVKGFMVSF